MNPEIPETLARATPPGSAARSLLAALRQSREPIAIALSAGADSSATLLWAMANFPRERLLALHFHHNVRGESADADLAHARRLAESLGVAFAFEKRPPGRPTDEASLRSDRLDFLMRACRAAGVAAILQGHHADDVAETLLMRLGRGSGAAGLAAPRPVSALPDDTPVLRPLLALRKADIERVLLAAGVPWRHDESNDSPDFATRNRIRHTVLPRWRDAIPGDAVAGAARTRALLQEDDDALNAWAARLASEIAPAGTSGPFHIPKPIPPRAVLRRLLHGLILRHPAAPSPSPRTLDALLDAMESGASHAACLTPGTTLHFRCGALHFQIAARSAPSRAAALLPVPGAIFWPDGACLAADFPARHEPPDNRTVAILRPPQCPVLLCAPRSRGERYRPLGSPGAQKLQDAMVNRKIPAALRDALPVVRDDSGPLWCPGLLPSENARLSEPELRPLRLTWTPPAAACAPLP